MEEKPVSTEETIETDEPVQKDRSLLYMGIILGTIILVMGYITLFVDDPSKLFKKKENTELAVSDQSSILNQSESMSEDQVRETLTKFIEAFYYDQRRGYFDPPSYFADITQTFYNYHNLTHRRIKEIYWKRMEDMDNFSRNWIVSTLEFKREDSRITATYWAKESYIRRSLNQRYSALIKYEMIIDETGKIVSLKEAEVKNEDIQALQPDSTSVQPDQVPATVGPANSTSTEKIYDVSLVDVAPEFNGGQKELNKYLSANFKYPSTAKQNAVHGRVYVAFVVEKDGQLSDIKIKQGLGSGCDEEALRLVRSSPKWNPGLIKESAVRTYFVLAVPCQPN
jgi:TonB family protein